jgi:2-aminoadipate transaminase
VQLTLQRHIDVPIYRQIVNQVREQIRLGTLPDGTRLPPVRQLAIECGLTRLTVHSAYAELQAQGLVQSHVGRGTFVTAGAPAVPLAQRHGEPAPWISQGVLANLLRWGEMGNLLSFAQAFPAVETYPSRELGRVLQVALTEEGALGYGHIQGEPVFREQVATVLLERGIAASPDHVLVTAGAQQGIDMALRALTEPGDVILVEEPTYPGVLELASLRGQRVVGIPRLEGELKLDALEAACVAHRPRLLYLVPAYNNPTGVSLSQESREAVLQVANEHSMWVLEDDTYGLLGFDRPAPLALQSLDQDERVVYITSFSKMLVPALRLGVLVAPVAVLPALAAAKQSSDLVCSALMQRAVAHYLRQGHMAGHLQAARALYVPRRDAMLSALERYLPQCTWTDPQGGLSLLVSLPAGIDEHDFTAEALRQGVGITPGATFYTKRQLQGSMRLSFGLHPPERIEEGVVMLGRVLQNHLLRRNSMSALVSGAAGPLV